ncbi:MAG: class I SAM-dependent methyltransferase [Nocardioides sp.]|nr:class I SAM-dependent methyltransferase [Nocardioides sp.]
MTDTSGSDYTARLEHRGSKRWKRLLNVQAPYQWNLRRQSLGRTLDVGCGVGRNLRSLERGSIGVDHNATSVARARAHGFDAFTTTEWRAHSSEFVGAFDGLLFAHVIEHMPREEAAALIKEYLPALRPGGRAFLICPQERGYATDQTHVEWTSGEDLVELVERCGLSTQGWKSFPAPRAFGRIFTYNEFTLLATKPGHS